MIVHGRLEWNKTEQQILQQLNLESGGAVQSALDNAVVRFSEPYCPWDSGTLAQTTRGIGTGEIVYIQEYAQYMYYGMLKTDERGRAYVGFGEKKPITTNIPLNYSRERNALAGPFWFERMVADRRDDLLKEAKSAVGK